MNQMDKNVTGKITLLEELNKSKEEAINAIKEFVNEIYTILKRLEKESILEVEEIFREMESVFEQERRDAETEMLNMKPSENGPQISEELSNDVKIGSDCKFTREYMVNARKSSSQAKIIFNEDSNIRETLCQFKSLGTVLTTKSRPSAYSVSGIKDINIRLSSDFGTCNVSDACLVGPNALLLVDNANKKLKRMNIVSESILDQCDMRAHPYCACAISKQEVAVTLSNNTIQFMSLGNTMSPTRQLNFSHCCYGIAYKDDKLFISDSSCSLYVHDMTGQLVQTIFQDTFGNNLFEYCRQIVISDKGDEIFVSDRTNRLRIFDLEGKHIDTFVDLNMDQVNGVSTDGRGNVFACGYASRNVIQIGHNLRKKMIIAKPSDGLVNPYSLCFAPSQCVLFVTQGNSDRVKAFQLK
ncbi:uncharacterized protein LOC123552891 [Mercenaria mercenaria]|uniref:uncharacterized protein LOC123552891 n=1 Tax=Mercenaria mercenaria TaxID=6596 RepID=UPI00234E37C1|nr:uncharacterized protein LOC123552891 [Mercenaria mercenaria]